MTRKLKVFDFEYNCIIIRNDKGEIDIVGYNSPYNANQDAQSQDDIKAAINDYEIIDKYSLQLGEKYNLIFTCRFVENEDKTFNQIMILKELKEWQK